MPLRGGGHSGVDPEDAKKWDTGDHPAWAELDRGDGPALHAELDRAAEPNVAGAIRLHLVFDEQLRRTAAASVRLDHVGEGDEVTAAALRELRVQYLVAISSMRVVTVTREDGDPQRFTEYIGEVRARTDRTYEETVREAVRLYRIATTVNLAPLKLVSEQPRVSVSTATRMMARAREAGLADDLIPRETYNRMRAEEEELTHPFPATNPSTGPSIGR